jgi:glycolate oxidase FAD binding subunit
MYSTAFQSIAAIVGEAHVRPATAADAIDGIQPQWIVEPASADEIARILRAANDGKLTVIARGGGTKLDWRNPLRSAELLISTLRLGQLIEHADGDMTATVQAGCRVSALNQFLAQRGQRLAVDSLWPDRATIGGILATNESAGRLRAAFGSLRDHLIGITVTLTDGTLARSGGKVVKNVAGYDLPKLFTGSLGTLGVIIEATFRLYPTPRAARMLRFTIDLAEGLSRLAGCPSVTTAVQFDVGDQTPSSISVLAEGFPETIEKKVSRVIAAMGAKTERLDRTVWLLRERLFDDADACVCAISLLSTRWPQVIARITAIAGRGWHVVGQAFGAGLLSLRPTPSAELITTLRRELTQLGASLTVLRCATSLKRHLDVWPNVGDALPLMRRVKEQFDPNGILAPGSFVGGI